MQVWRNNNLDTRSETKTFTRSEHQRRGNSISSLRLRVGELKSATFLKLHILSASLHFDSHDNVKTPFAVLEIVVWVKFTGAEII